MMSSSHNLPITEQAHSLVRDLQSNPDIIPPFKGAQLAKCAQQITNMVSVTAIRNQIMGTDRDKEITLVKVRQLAIDRIKRCCCAYIAERMKRLKKLRWKHAGLVPEEVKRNLSPDELNWLQKYNALIYRYQADFGENGLNLLNFIEPPKALRMDVVAVKDYGEFETGDGTTVVLSKGSTVSLPIQDSEMMIRRGILKEVDNETN